MENKQKILWITRTAVFLALLIVLQAVTAPLGNTLVTGSIVNFLLIVSVMGCGLSSGLAVAVLSPVLAKLFGIGPFWSLIPFIIAGNLALILLWHGIGNRKFGSRLVPYVAALAAAALSKFLVLYVGIVKIAIPMLLHLPEKQAAVVSATFSVLQLVTALIGGALFLLVQPVLRAALTKKNRISS